MRDLTAHPAYAGCDDPACTFCNPAMEGRTGVSTVEARTGHDEMGHGRRAAGRTDANGHSLCDDPDCSACRMQEAAALREKTYRDFDGEPDMSVKLTFPEPPTGDYDEPRDESDEPPYLLEVLGDVWAALRGFLTRRIVLMSRTVEQIEEEWFNKGFEDGRADERRKNDRAVDDAYRTGHRDGVRVGMRLTFEDVFLTGEIPSPPIVPPKDPNDMTDLDGSSPGGQGNMTKAVPGGLALHEPRTLATVLDDLVAVASAAAYYPPADQERAARRIEALTAEALRHDIGSGRV